MKTQACIAIGINNYHFFQPLSYAQQDAQALRDFLVGEVGLASERCLLLSDTSPPVDELSTYPSRENILQWLARCCQQLQPSDVLWFFWCGYGASWEGQDYLMPIDGSPDNIQQTGIEAKTILKTLKASPAETVLVLLDMNRATSMQADDPIGTDTVALAQQLEIPTILSCRPSQFSRESGSLRHGLFAAALLEGLRYNRCITVENLDRYLTARLPQLSEHLCLPVQEPLAVVNPREKIYQPIWQPRENRKLVANGSHPPENGYALSANGSKNGKAEAANDIGLPLERELANALSRQKVNGKNATIEKYVPTRQKIGMENGQVERGAIAKKTAYIENGSSSLAGGAVKANKQGRSQQQILMWSGAAAVALVLGIFVSKAAFEERKPSETSEKMKPQEVASSPSAPAQNKAPGEGQTTQIQQKTASAQSSVLLDRALLAIQPTDASKFGYAIALASKIPPEDALYEQAQQDIDRWSAVIFDIARGRAKQGNFTGAIAAAKLLPSDRLKLKAQAQQLASQWQRQLQQQQTNEKLLKTAAATIRKKQVSTYASAIATLSKIPPTQPKYGEAQQLIAQWSQAILDIAQSRAARGRLSTAIEAAKLVPPKTPAYADAQKAIGQWKRQLSR